MSASTNPTGERFLTAATRVTLVRILGIPVFVLLMYYYLDSLRRQQSDERWRVAALAVFTAIALTDALDGYLARSRGEITRWGRILDPLADKALLISAVVLLTRPSLPELQPQLPVYLTAAVISRDAILVLGYLLVHQYAASIEVRPRLTGKLATFLLMVAIIWALANGPIEPFRWICRAATLFTVTAGLQYLWDGIRHLERGSG